MSNFWEKVDEELNFRGMPRKELARIADFPDSYISKGIARKSVPSADLALKISHALNVPLEYLLGMNQGGNEKVCSEDAHRLLHKYGKLISFLESIDEHDMNVLKQFLLACSVS